MTKTASIVDLLEEQVKKGTLIGKLHENRLYNIGQLLRVTLFKGADYFQDDFSGSENYHWSKESEQVEDKFSPGAQFVGYHEAILTHTPNDINRILLCMGWNPFRNAESKKLASFIPVPKSPHYVDGRSGSNHTINFYQDAVHSVEIIEPSYHTKKVINPRAK